MHGFSENLHIAPRIVTASIIRRKLQPFHHIIKGMSNALMM